MMPPEKRCDSWVRSTAVEDPVEISSTWNRALEEAAEFVASPSTRGNIRIRL